MKLTKSKLKQIIKEEIQKALKEGFPDIPVGASPSHGRRQYTNLELKQIERFRNDILGQLAYAEQNKGKPAADAVLEDIILNAVGLRKEVAKQIQSERAWG